MHFIVKISYKISYNLVTLPKNPNFRHFFRKMLDDFRKVRYNKNSENNVELLSLVLLSPFFCSTYVFRRWCISSGNFFRQHRIIIAYKQKAPSPKAECVEKHSIFHRKGTLNQTVRDFVAARYRFANANIIFNFAVCFRRPRYRVFRYRKIFFMTAKTCSTLQRTDDF